MEKSLQKLKYPHVNLALVGILFILASHAMILYEQNSLALESFLIWVLGLIIIGLLFVFGTRLVEKDGFINGFKNGFKNGFRDGVGNGTQK